MAIRRLSISVPERTEVAIRAAASAAGVPVSTWLATAAAHAAAQQMALADGLAALAEYEAEHGELDPVGVERAAQELAAARAWRTAG